MRMTWVGRHDLGGRRAARRAAGALVLAAGLLGVGRAAAADVTASWDGMLAAKRGPQGIVAASFVQTGTSVIGTVAMNLDDGSASGLFPVVGTQRGSKLKLSGVDAAAGAKLTWKGKVVGDTLVGKGRVKGGLLTMNGKLPMAKRHDVPPADPPEHCESEFFTGQVMGRVLSICSACHMQGGAAQATSFRVTMSDPLATQDSVALHVDFANPPASRILQKPLGALPHGGGVRLVAGSEEYGILEQWVNLVAGGRQCGGGPADAPMLPMASWELAVRAAMDLMGKRPTPAQLDQIEANPDVYPALVDQWLHTPEFLARVKDTYDDALLVRREDFNDERRDETDAIYGEALELIGYIVDNDRPFTEIGTADYTVANAMFQRNRRRMPYAMEPVAGDAWRPTHYTDGRPHAGLLSTSAFYEVWDTNNTNKNRRRANRWSIVFHCYNFLDTPVDVTRDVDNNDAGAVLSAVTTRADCKGCHDRLDPMASFLFPTDNASGLEDGNGTSFRTDFFSANPERWRTANLRPPAVYGKPGTDLQDLGRLLVGHPRFAECQTRRAFEMLFQRKPQSNRELGLVQSIAQAWRTQDGHDFRKLVKRWMTSNAYTERPSNDDPAWVRRASPERLESLVADVAGFTWTRNPDDDQDDNNPDSDPPRTEPVPLLTTEERAFKVILGGINGTSVTGRATNLNASVLMVTRKLAALAASAAVEDELALPDAQRRLLAGVAGDEDPAADEAAIRAVLSRLARRMYGVHWAPDSPHVDRLVNLYGALWNDRTQAGDGAGQVPGEPGVRAWRGVLVAMLRSPRLITY
ncbi:MAG: hypothetical protein KIT14_10195 [bacterium]|nr:hypothetical protein [bacterium]